MYEFPALHWCKDARVLEVGVGYGYGISILAPASSEVVGVDIYERCIEYAKEKYPFPNVRYECVDICTWSEQGASYQVAVMIDIIEHIHDPLSALRNVHRLLKPGGILFMSTPWPNLKEDGSPVNPHHIREYFPDEFHSLAKEVFPDAVLYSKANDNLMILAQKKAEDRDWRRLAVDAYIGACEVFVPQESADKIKIAVAGRNIGILLHGSSVAELESHREELSDLDVCFCSMNYFRAPEERILNPVDKTLSIVFCSSEEEIVKRTADLAEFLGRHERNLLITTSEAAELIPEITEVHRDRICLVGKPRLPQNLMPNSLNVFLQVLLKTGISSRYIALFGADGLLTKGTKVSETYYGKERLVTEKRTWNLVNDTILFNFSFPLFYRMENRPCFPQTVVINCSPDSYLTVFPRISQTEGLALLKEGDQSREFARASAPHEGGDSDTEYGKFSISCRKEECIIMETSVHPLELTPTECMDAVSNGKIIVGQGTCGDAIRVVDIALSTKPELIDSHLGYNFIRYGGQIYCLSISIPDVDVEYLDDDTLQRLSDEGLLYIVTFVQEGRSLLEKKKWLPSPCLVDMDAGYNIVRYHDMFHALALSVGPFDLTTASELTMEALRKESRLFSALSLSEVKQMIRQHLEIADTVNSASTLNNGRIREKGKALFLVTAGAEYPQHLPELEGYEVWHLVPQSHVRKPGQNYLIYQSLSFADGSALKEYGFSLAVFRYEKNLAPQGIERFLLSFADRALALFPNGERRLYEGTAFSRLQYNSSYLRSMYASIPPLAGKKALEIGCSDGLTCDLVAKEGAGFVVGVDAVPPRGPLFHHPRFSHHVMDAHALEFADGLFDVVFSIATMEHCRDPYTVLQEIRRVLKPGGHAYIQAGPLYHSPFGHHMFGYFDDYPWIHLRLSPEEILTYCKQRGIDTIIEQKMGIPAQEYLSAMLNVRHINGLLLSGYSIDKFAALPDIEVLAFRKSYEGANLITPQIHNEINTVSAEDLVLHGFEFVFRRI